MNAWKRWPRIILITALALTVAWLVLPPAGLAAIVDDPTKGWFLTPEAEARTAAGECGTLAVCREYCLYGQPMGRFQCFDI